MKAKFSTYMDIDLQGMDTHELVAMKETIDKILTGRNIDSFEIVISDVLHDTRAINALVKVLGKLPKEITIKEVALVPLERLEKCTNFGKVAVNRINTMLASYGYKALK